LVVGLGNPGPDYARTRHNVGYLVADAFARQIGAEFTLRKFQSELAEGRCGAEKVWIMKPQTWMNRSGEAVGPALHFWKVELGELVVVHDDLELEAYRVQLKVGGGHGGHNGLKSVNGNVGGVDYARVRVGVGRPPPMMDPADYVLGRFPKGEQEALDGCVERAVEAVRLAVELGAAKAMNQVNRRRSSADA
ncbi:MAG TPA: aminoacyl-tRNA hydrolase, partial [Anaeromyxobacteraceae bacterium]|nr:aminoacyl-tRNA hydrolase [Anaeromyxobacteraceae bacterium]